MVKLRKGLEAFTVMDGVDAGKTFQKNQSYPVAPKGYENRFEKIRPKASPAKTTESKGSKK